MKNKFEKLTDDNFNHGHIISKVSKYIYRIDISINIFMNSDPACCGRWWAFSNTSNMDWRVGHFIVGGCWLVEEINDVFIVKL